MRERLTIELRDFKLRVGKVIMRRLRGMTAVLFLVAGLSWGPPARGQTTEQEIAAKLVGRPLYLRGFWAKNDLRFNTAGQIETPTEQAPFTESGIEVRSVKLTQGELLIKGKRIALEFLPDERVKRVDAKSKITVRIDGDTSDYGEALNAIFTDDLAGMTPTLPSYWQPYARTHFPKLIFSGEKYEKPKGTPKLDLSAPKRIPADINGSSAAARAKNADTAKQHIGGDIKAPKVLKAFDPEFTPVARKLHYSGSVELYLIVERDGSISHVSIVKPAGLGLDEEAVASVEKYQFAPATQDGNPVAVDLYIDVNFQIF
jgi:TonB family protein